LVTRCLAKQPDRRFQSAGDLAYALRAQASGAGAMPAVVSPSPTRPCVAVLPLQNFSASKAETDYVVDAMTEVLIAELAKNRFFRVVSRTTMMQFKETKKPLRQLARELETDVVVEGSVLLGGSRIRITAQLIRATTDEHLWAESYERQSPDVLVVQ